MRADLRARLPVLVPVGGVVGVVEADGVGERAGGVHVELERALVIAARPEVERDRVRLDDAVAAGEALDDGGVGLRAVEGDVDGVVVVEDADGRRVARGGAVGGDLLGEGRRGGGEGPDGIVDLAVESGWGWGADGVEVR